jgi:hypothetical protein
MGYTISGILINQLPNTEIFEADFEVEKITLADRTDLNPKNLTISFSDHSTFIFLESIFYKNISENEELTKLEAQLCEFFPNSSILIVAINDTSDITGYSYLKSSMKIRTKMVAQGRPFLDFGKLNENEKMLHDQIVRYIEKNPKTKTSLFDHTKNMSELEKSKFELIFRDSLYQKINKENNFEYLGGSLDRYCIDEILQNEFKTNWTKIEAQKSYAFNKKKFNFDKESIQNFINLAWQKSINPT